MGSICTLTTDFGRKDPYVAAMKGVLLSGVPGIQILDLSHEIGPQNVHHASRFLGDSLSYFPEGTLHLIVVDPGVGTDRSIVIAQGGGQTLVSPDNGVLSSWWRKTPGAQCVRVERDDLWPPGPSHTFHGRDVFCPLVVALLRGTIAWEACGSSCLPLLLPESTFLRAGNRVSGELETLDHFGNCITSIPVKALPNSLRNLTLLPGRRSMRWVQTYGEGTPGELVALEGSTGFLEVAVVHGSAKEELGASEGQRFEFELES